MRPSKLTTHQQDVMNVVLFRSPLDQIYRVYNIEPIKNPGNILLSCFFEKQNSYREILVKFEQDSGTLMSEKRVTCEFIANLIQLRDEMDKRKVQKSTTRFGFYLSAAQTSIMRHAIDQNIEIQCSTN